MTEYFSIQAKYSHITQEKLSIASTCQPRRVFIEKSTDIRLFFFEVSGV
jgi:hypothetical protein